MCGICLVVGRDKAARPSAAELCSEILFKLQHRGQEGAKIYAADGDAVTTLGGYGMVSQMIDTGQLAAISGTRAIGQVRYATYGPSQAQNIQPFKMATRDGSLIFAHNGQFGSPDEIEAQRAALMSRGFAFHSDTDSELFGGQFALSGARDLAGRLRDGFRQNIGSAAVVGMIGDTGFAGRRVGNRPLFMAEIEDGGMVFASEDYMLRELVVRGNRVRFSKIRECPPGTIFVWQDGELSTHPIWESEFESRFCLFELFYFSHPLSTFHGVYLSRLRRGFGGALAEKAPAEADLVASVPDSGNSAAEGYAEASGLPRRSAVTRDHYITRTFIGGAQAERTEGAGRKYNIDRSLVDGKSVVIVDDSLVRGTTLTRLVRRLRAAGAARIHLRIASPPIRYPSYDGTNIRSQDELIAAGMRPPEIARRLGADSLAYLPLENAYAVIGDLTETGREHGNFCDAIFTGEYWHRVGTDAHPHR